VLLVRSLSSSLFFASVLSVSTHREAAATLVSSKQTSLAVRILYSLSTDQYTNTYMHDYI
jgi:hypothetical protein